MRKHGRKDANQNPLVRLGESLGQVEAGPNRVTLSQGAAMTLFSVFFFSLLAFAALNWHRANQR